MKELKESYYKFDDFLKAQLLLLIVTSLSWSLIVPIIIKLQGLLWTTSIIAAYLIIGKMAIFIMPYVKNTKLKTLYKIRFVLEFIYFLSLSLYFIEPVYFLYMESSLAVIYGIFMQTFLINYNTFLIDEYNSKVFQDTQYIEKLFLSGASAIGLLIVIIIDYITPSIDDNIKVFAIFIAISLCLQFLNYMKFWRNID